MAVRLLVPLTEESALRWIKRGSGWAVIVALLGFVNTLVMEKSPWGFLDLAIGIVLAVFIRRGSRGAAKGMLFYFIAGKLYQILATPAKIPAFAGLLLFGYIFLNTLRATLFLHRIKVASQPPAPPRSRVGMGIRGHALAVIAAVLVLVGVFQVVKYSIRHAPAVNAAPTAQLPIDPDVRTGKLRNGVRYFVRRNRRPAGYAELRLVVNVGAVLESDDERGLAHMVEHMVFRGTKLFPGHRSSEYLQSIGLTLGDEVNATTTFDETVYRMTIPSKRPGVLDTSLAIVTEVAAASLRAACRREGAVIDVPLDASGALWRKAAINRAEEERLRKDVVERLKRLEDADPGGDVEI